MAFRFQRKLIATAAAMLPALLGATPAAANFFWKAPDMRGTPVRGDEPDLGYSLPGATPAELEAGLVWSMRAGLNVGALQCQFDPTLLTLNQYNHMLDHHRAELGRAFATLTNYFKRVNKKGWQMQLDQFGTRTYSGYSTVGAQLTFCEAASAIGRDAVFTCKGQFHTLAANRMRELRNSLVRAGEQQFRFWIPPTTVSFPPLDDRCWKKEQLTPKCRKAWAGA